MAPPKADEKAQLSDPLQGTAPQLARALLEAKPGQYDLFRTTLEKAIGAQPSARARVDLQDQSTFDKDIADLLGHVEERIRIGLDEPWLSDHGYAWRPPPDLKSFSTKEEFDKARDSQAQFQTNLLRLYNDPEERWARALTETFVFLMYGGPPVTYSRPTQDGIVFHDADFFSQGMFPRVYPLSLACQHLTTFAVLSRGKTPSEVGTDGLACSGNSATRPAFKKGTKFTRKGECGTTSCILDHVGPGDAVFFNFHGVDSGSQEPTLSDDEKKTVTTPGTIHAGTVLRKWGQRLQYIDTGVLTSSGVPGATEGGTTDHDWATERLGPYKDAVGIGALGETPPNLSELAVTLGKARPLAVARLVVFDQRNRMFVNEKGVKFIRKYRVRFASRLLQLWLDDGGVPLSKLIWSLRDPPTSGLHLAWWVYLPKGDWAKRFVPEGATAKPVDALLNPRGDLDSLYSCNILFGEQDGKVTVYRRFEKKTKDGLKAGWSRNFGVEAGLPSDSAPWVAVRPPGSKAKDEQLPGVMFEDWSQTTRAYGAAYRVADPAALAGEQFHDKVGVPFFDQGL